MCIQVADSRADYVSARDEFAECRPGPSILKQRSQGGINRFQEMALGSLYGSGLAAAEALVKEWHTLTFFDSRFDVLARAVAR